MSIDNLDDMIKKYTEVLENMGRAYGGEEERTVVTPSVAQKEEVSEQTTTYSDTEENAEKDPETATETPENTDDGQLNDDEQDSAANDGDKEAADSELTSSADFTAAVFSGEQTYPVEGAKIVVYRDDNIYAFLETDKNGTTKKMSLPAFAKENSLEADNPLRSVDYYADAFAEGFTAQKGLLVQAVGGSEIFL